MKRNKVIGIDLGSSNTIIYLSSMDSIIFNEPTIIASDKSGTKESNIGYIAKKMVGRTPYSIETISFVKNGLVTSTNQAISYLKSAFNNLKLNKELRSSTLIFATPDEVNEVQQNALLEIAKNLNVKEIYLEPISKLTAFGCGISPYSPSGNMFVNIGGGSTNIGVVASGELVKGKTIPLGSDNYEKEIIRFIRDKYHVIIGEKTAENIKIKIGNLNKASENRAFEVKGQDVISSLPHKFIITSQELYFPLSKVASDIAFEIQRFIESLPTELANDVSSLGITFSGGGSLLNETKKFFSDKLSVQCSISSTPMLTVVNGIRELLSNDDGTFN